MAKVIPFKGVRPKPEFARNVAALPYDVYNVEEARKVIEKENAKKLKRIWKNWKKSIWSKMKILAFIFTS